MRGTVDIGYGQNYNGQWVEDFESIVTGPLDPKEHAYNIDGTINATSLIVGGQRLYLRWGSYNYYVKYSYTTSRVDGTTPQGDRAQDPNKSPDKPPITVPPGTTPTTGAKPAPGGIPKRPDGRPDIDDAFDNGVDGIRDFPGWHGGGTSKPSNPTGKPKNPTPDPPVKAKTPKPTPKPSPLPGSPPVVGYPSPPVTDKPTPVPSNPNPSPLPGTIPNPIPQPPSPSKPNPNPGNPGRQPDNPTPQPPTNPTKNPNPDPTPTPYNPSDPAPQPPYGSYVPGKGTVLGFDLLGRTYYNPFGESTRSGQVGEIISVTNNSQKDNNGREAIVRAYPIIGILSPPINQPDPIPELKNSTPVNRNTGSTIQIKPDPQPPKEEPKIGTPGGGGSTCLYPGYHPDVMGGHSTTQTSVGAVNTLISGTTNVSVNAVGKNVDKIVEAVGTPIAGKASTIFNAIDNVQSFTEKFAKATRLDKVYNALTLFLVIHNASQLAQNLGQSLDELINTGLQAIGIRDEKDEPLSISGAIGGGVSDFIKSIIGEDVYNSASLAWKKGSAIYSASVNIADAITQPLAGLASGLTQVGNNTGKIGNALVKSGTVLENAYDKMSENVQVNTGKLAQLNNYINDGNSAVELVDSFTELARVPLETKESFDNVKTELDGLKTKMNEEVATKKTEDATAKTASESPSIADLDVFKNLF